MNIPPNHELRPSQSQSCGTTFVRSGAAAIVITVPAEMSGSHRLLINRHQHLVIQEQMRIHRLEQSYHQQSDSFEQETCKHCWYCCIKILSITITNTTRHMSPKCEKTNDISSNIPTDTKKRLASVSRKGSTRSLMPLTFRKC